MSKVFPVIGVAGALAGTWIFLGGGVEAFSCRPGLIPNGTENNCLNCHLSQLGGGPRNLFGAAVDAVAVSCEPFWGPALASKDSDGDGFTNGEELGDPEGSWKQGDPAPGDPARVTLPGNASSFPSAAADFVRGDANADGSVDLSDAVDVLARLFLGKPAPACAEAADGNGDGGLDVSDTVYVLSFLFIGGAPPPAPYPECGAAQADDDCGSFPPCVPIAPAAG